MGTVFIRSIILYILVIVTIRFTGKRQIGELQPSELVLTILISNIAAMPIEDTGIPLLAGIVPILTLACLEVVLSYIASRSASFDNMISGNPKVIIENGKVDQKTLHDLRMSPSDLLEQLRQNSIYELNDATLAIIETNGKMSIGDYNKLTSMPKVQVIENGKIMKNFLEYCGVSHQWVTDTLRAENISLKDVFIMTCNKKKEYTIIRKEHRE